MKKLDPRLIFVVKILMKGAEFVVEAIIIPGCTIHALVNVKRGAIKSPFFTKKMFMANVFHPGKLCSQGLRYSSFRKG